MDGRFDGDSINKAWRITCDELEIGNGQLCTEELQLEERLCSEKTLIFGTCEASTLTTKITNNVFPLKGKVLTVFILIKGKEPFRLGNYRVDEDKPTADRKYRDITAYDAMYDILQADVTAWYNSLAFPLSLREFRGSLAAHCGLEQEPAELANDDMQVEKTVEADRLTGKDVLTAICEINGCFGHISRAGRLEYKVLKEIISGLYPAPDLYPSPELYPSAPNTERIHAGSYQDCQYEDYLVRPVDALQIRDQEDDVGVIVGNPDNNQNNCYIIQDNFLLYGKGTGELRPIAQRALEVMAKVHYRPARIEARGNPEYEVGEAVRVVTQTEVVETYILQRTLTGIQALRDIYTADGEEWQGEKASGIHEQIVRLKGRSNRLSRTIEETRSEIVNLEGRTNTLIQQTDSRILAEAQRALEAEGTLSAALQIEADKISAEVRRALEAEGTLSAALQIEADKISAEVRRALEAEGTLSATLQIEADRISAEVRRATEAEGRLSAAVELTAGELEAKVSRGSVVAEINMTPEQVRIDAQRIDLAGLVNAEELVARYATLHDVEVVNARFGHLSASNITSGVLSVDRIDMEELAGWGGTYRILKTSALYVSPGNSDYQIFMPHTVTIGGIRMKVLAADFD